MENNVKAALCSFLTAALLTAVAQNPARVDISGVPSVNLKFVEQQGVKIGYGHWQSPGNVEKYLTTSYPVSKEWKQGVVTFTPETDGRLRVVLLGPAMVGGKETRLKPAGVYYDNIRVNGKLINNGDFEAGKKGFGFYAREKRYPGRVVFNPAIAESGNACGLAWHDGEIAFGLPVKAKQPVTLSFSYRDGGEVPPISKANNFYPLSLRASANMGFADETPGDGKGGWTDQGPKNDLRLFQPGLKSFHGWPFQVIDPVKNDGRSCVIFRSSNSKFGREEIVLPVNQECNAIALLNASAWAKPGSVAATVEVTFANGKKQQFPLRVGKETGDWWNPKQLPNADVVWRSGGDSGEIGLYLTCLKWPEPARVRCVTITPGREGVVFALVAATAGLVRSSEDDVSHLVWQVPLPQKSALTALPLEVVKLEMAKKNFPAELFFEERKNWARLEVLDQTGKKLDHCIVKFTRNFSPLILVRTNGKATSLQLKIGEEKTGKILSPRQAFRQFTGREQANYRADEWANGIIVYPEDAEQKETRMVADEDSFYNSATAMSSDSPEWHYTFELKEPKAYKLYIYSRSPENHTNYMFLSVDNGETIKLGGNFNMPSTYYWSGGERIFLKPGKHTIRLFSIAAKARRKNLSLAKLYLAEDLLTPVQPGLPEELAALKTAGVFVYGSGELLPMKNTSSDRLRRVVNEEHSFPDLSSLTEESAIDRHGAPSAVGTGFRFADGTLLPQIWGCNMNDGPLYDLAMDNRIGGDSLDQFLKRVRAMGYSTVRYMISTLPREWGMNQNHIQMPLLSRKPLKFAPEFLTNLQKLIAACHRNGLYLSLTLWLDNSFFSDLGAERNNHAYIGFFHPEALQREKEIVRMVLSTPNPYRENLPPAKDPTLLIYEIENERTYVATFLMNNPSNWRKLPPATREILYGRWTDSLEKKYRNVDSLKNSWNLSSLSGCLRDSRKSEVFGNIEFPPVWNMKEWGNDTSELKFKLDDLRISEASFGREKRSNPMVSDGLEFMYSLYRDYLREMYSYARSLGFKGIITANGADCELYYSQRAGANEALDATSGGTGYWNRTGYGFLRSLGWLAPLVYFAASEKPMISREYGANLVHENSWWGNLIAATVQKAMGKAYLFNFALGISSLYAPDWLYPDDGFEKKEQVNLNQEAHLYSHFANLASAIAVRSPELKKPEFRLEIGYPLDNVCYAAPFRGYNKMTLNDFTPFLYCDSSVRTFRGGYDGNADFVVNEPSTPAGDYSRAKHLFAIRPHSPLNRYGRPEKEWFHGRNFQAEGFVDTAAERKALYDALQKAGADMPVSFDEFGKVWRDAGKHLELDTRSVTFRAETKDFSAFIGNVKNGEKKMPGAFRLSGAEDAWSFFGKLPDSSTLFFAVMNGSADLKSAGNLRYLFLGGRQITVTMNGKPYLSLLGGSTVNIALKSDAPLANASCVYVTFFRNRSMATPAEITFARKIRKVEACDREGHVIAEVPFTQGTFRNLWENGRQISYYKVTF